MTTNGRISHDTAPGGGVSAAVLEKAATVNSTGVLDRVQPGVSKFQIAPDWVKGTRAPHDTPVDFDTESARRQAAEKTFMATVRKARQDPLAAASNITGAFGPAIQAMVANSPVNQIAQWAKTIDKSFTISSDLVPYDLTAPTLLIYPVYTPLRNRFPRPQGQGRSHEAKVMTSILGSQPGVFANPAQRISIPELPGGGSLSPTNWPNQLPSFGSQNLVDVNIPYKFFGLTEAATWLAQFAGQGFDDIAALASLVLLQETMLAEERALIGATSINLSTPVAPTVTSTATAGGYAFVTAVNYYGETVASPASQETAGGDVLTLTPVPGALSYNVYFGPTNSASASFLVGTTAGTNFTLPAAVPTAGTHPPTADTGTGSSNDYEGIISVLSGHAATGSVYPAGYEAGYINQAVGSAGLSINVLQDAFRGVYNGGQTSYFADPSEVWGEASDIKGLSNELGASSGDLNYSIFINQDQVNNAIAGLAVSQFANPVTRSTVKLTVHPYFPQGTAVGMSYTLPQVQTNVSNVWENVMVQDYLSIAWPVVDVTFRYSLFFYGALFCPAPQYNFLLQGMDPSTT